MAIINGTIADGATASFTGGTSKTLVSSGVSVPNGIQVMDASVTDFRIRPSVTFKNKVPKLGSDGEWGKGARSANVVLPKILTSGKQGFPCVRINLEDFPEMTQAEIDKLRSYAAQIILDADFDAFWRTGATS